MAKKKRRKSNDNPVDFSSAVDMYKDTIEEFYKAVEEKQPLCDENYYLSLQILEQIFQQMESLGEHRHSYAVLEKGFHYHPDLHCFFEDDPFINGLFNKHVGAIHRKKGQSRQVTVKNTFAPPPWKPKK